MKIITQPSISLLASPLVHAHPVYELPRDGTPAERLIATGGKVCYDTYGVDGNPVASHVRNLVAQGHGAVSEHATVTLFVAGISRGCSHEWVRHRAGWSYSQRSTRYTSEEDAAIVLEPAYAALYDRERDAHLGAAAPLAAEDRAALNGALENARRDFATYAIQLDYWTRKNPDGLTGPTLRKWARGKARQWLPTALETRLVVTANLRAWRHFFLLRTAAGAEPEIRRVAAACFALVEPIAPSVFADLERGEHQGILTLRGRGI